MKKLSLLILLSFNLDAHDIPQKFDDLSNLSNKLFLSVMDKTMEVDKSCNKELPASISFFSADAKFDGTNLKFCEIGNGLYGVPVPAYALLNNQKAILYPPYWEFLWLFTTQFNIPVWCIKYPTAHVAEKTLKKLGGKIFYKIDEFEDFLEKKYPEEKFIRNKPKLIEKHIGILAYAGERISNDKLEEFKKRHPGILFINDFQELYQRRKDKIHKIFDNEFLSQFRPKWGVYSTIYTQSLVEKIQHEINSDLYIIKPIVGRQAQGVILIDNKDLNQILKSILNKKNKKQKNRAVGKNKKFDWQDYEFDKFIVEEFVESKIILKNNQPYDPTLRLGFILSQNNGKIRVTLINAFWKFPPQSLNSVSSIQEKHVTKPMVGAHDPAVNTDQSDTNKIYEILYNMLPKLYEKIINLKN